jgi:ABC-2 type transport system permease protein
VAAVAELLQRPTATAPASAAAPPGRPGAARLLRGQVVHASREAIRTPASLLVSLALPVLFLVISGLAVGATPMEGGASDAAIQRLVPGAAVFAVAMAAFVMLAFGVATADEQGVLKRLRGTPLPVWAYLAGRAGAAAWIAVVGTASMLVVGVLAYGLVVDPLRLPALLVSLVVVIVTFAALGFAVAAVVRSAQAVLSVTMGAVVLLSFVSAVFVVEGDLPRWAEAIGLLFPLRHAVEVLALPLAADVAGVGLAWSHLTALVAWALLGTLFASRYAGRDRSAAIVTRSRHGGTVPHTAHRSVLRFGGPSGAAMVWGQFRHANRGVWREPVYAFFALAFPSLFVVLLPLVIGDPEVDGTAFSVWMTTGMPVFGLALIAYVTLPETVAHARDQGILKRLRGTPLPAWAYLTGRVASTYWIVGLAVAIVLLLGWRVYDVTPVAAGWVPLLVTLVLGTTCLGALGLTVASLVPDAEAVPGVTLATFMPLVFLSGVFPLAGVLPEVVTDAVALLPLAPLIDATRAAFLDGAWAVRELAIVAAWAVVGGGVAVWRFRWEP